MLDTIIYKNGDIETASRFKPSDPRLSVERRGRVVTRVADGVFTTQCDPPIAEPLEVDTEAHIRAFHDECVQRFAEGK